MFLWFPILCLLGADPAPWHLAGWNCRAVVELPQDGGASGDTAAVKVLCQGRGKEDGSDYRVMDGAGAAVPFQVVFHDATRYSLLAFRAANPAGRYYVYFGDPQAERAAEELPGESAPGSGPPQGAWVPRGLVYTTLQRPEGDNPKTIEEMAALISGSKVKYGARFQPRISDGYNPFGPSDNYISIYRGWIDIPNAGTYKFCTASNEASFSFLDGKPLVHWPGRHTAERGERGEKNAAVDVTAGLHYVEYYHEEVVLQQMAFLGWSPPGTPMGAFSGIPETAFPQPIQAAVAAYEGPGQPLVTFEPQIVDSIWPEDRHEGQYTRVRFHANGAAESAGMQFHWSFGDGQSAAGAEVEHVYLSLGTYQVNVSTAGPGGPSAATWPLEVYEIQHAFEDIPAGKPSDYAALVKTYDRAALEAAAYRELPFLLAEGGDATAGLEAGRQFVEKFAASHAEMLPQVRRLMAQCALQLGEGSIDEAIANYQASISADTPLVEKLDVLARLIRLLAIDRELPDKAAEVLAQVEATVQGAKLDDDSRAAYRRAVIAAGDARLWHADLEGARALYKRAESLSVQKVPAQVRAARIGAYPNAIREFIASGETDAALDLVDQWEQSFPTDKPAGQTFFWRGKVLALEGRHRDAARHLARAVVLAQGSAFESEARWLLAASLETIGKTDEARRELAKLIASGANDRFGKLAQERLKAIKDK